MPSFVVDPILCTTPETDADPNEVAQWLASTTRFLYPGSQPLASSVASQLWRSLRKTGLTEDTFATGKLLRICAATLAGRLDEVKVDHRPKRETDSPDSSQQTRRSDEAKAWRLTITKMGAGYRLHYWHIPARGERIEQIEFANVLRDRDPSLSPRSDRLLLDAPPHQGDELFQRGGHRHVIPGADDLHVAASGEGLREADDPSAQWNEEAELERGDGGAQGQARE